MTVYSYLGYSQSLVLIISAIGVAFYLYCRYKITHWKRRGVPQLDGTDLIFGDYKSGILFRTPPAYHLGQIYQKAPKDSPFIGFYIFQKPCILLRDPRIIKHVLIQDFENFSNRYFSGSTQKDSINQFNLFGLRSPGWDYLRGRISPIFSLSKLKQSFPMLLENGQPMFDYIEKKGADVDGAKVLDIQVLHYKYTADLISNLSLGIKTDSFNNPDSEYTKTLMTFFKGLRRMVALVTVFFFPGLVDIVGSRILLDLPYIRKTFWEALENREKSGNKRGDLLDAIIELKNGKQNSLYRFEGENLYCQTGMYFSGFESSCIAATITLIEMAKNPELQKLAREDIRQAIDQHGWTFEAFNNMKYLDQCISEGARLYPSVSTIDRYAKEDYKIPGTDVVLKKGTPIFVSLYGLHRDERFFEDPLEFRPDRFNGTKIISDAYMPFGIGPRMCLGSKIGQMHAKIFLSKILFRYEVSKQPGESKIDSRSTFTIMENKVNLAFKKIN